MTQGTFIRGAPMTLRRPKTKKELIEALKVAPDRVVLEATSAFGDEYEGLIVDAPDGNYYVVGPDPFRSRKWYARLSVRGGKVTVG